MFAWKINPIKPLNWKIRHKIRLVLIFRTVWREVPKNKNAKTLGLNLILILHLLFWRRCSLCSVAFPRNATRQLTLARTRFSPTTWALTLFLRNKVLPETSTPANGVPHSSPAAQARCRISEKWASLEWGSSLRSKRVCGAAGFLAHVTTPCSIKCLRCSHFSIVISIFFQLVPTPCKVPRAPASILHKNSFTKAFVGMVLSSTLSNSSMAF